MCNHILTRGKNKGRNCKINGKYNGFCKRHMQVVVEPVVVHAVQVNNDCCQFYLKKQKRTCKFKGKYNGYCKRHMPKEEEKKECCEESCLEECSICLCDIENKKETSVTKCNHIFHKGCIKEWCKENNTCPICRRRDPVVKMKRKRRAPRPPPIVERPIVQDIHHIMGDLNGMGMNERIRHIMAVLHAMRA